MLAEDAVVDSVDDDGEVDDDDEQEASHGASISDKDLKERVRTAIERLENGARCW